MPDMSALTERQREIYDFIRSKIEGRGYGPTVREIGSAFDIKSPNGVMCHLNALVKKGLITRQDRSARAIQLVGHKIGSAGVPMLGAVAAGSPIQPPDKHDDRLEFNELFGASNLYALKVRGNSMIEDHIEDGDYVIIKKQETAENSQRVVALVNGEVTLKKFYKKKDQVRLEPCNVKMEPIVVHPGDDIKVLGVLSGVIRKC
jgi:repressor LexA